MYRIKSEIRTATGSRAFEATIAAIGLAALILLLILPSQAQAQGSIRAWGMGGALTASSRGLDAVEFNPANLALTQGTNVGLAGVALDVNNNALSLDRYNEITGSYLNESDKEQLLDDIPDSGF